jgi:negative regulator of sigma E activity
MIRKTVSPMPQDSLSALLDGECSSAELDQLLDEMERSPELAAQWSRLCMARDAQAGTRIAAGQADFCSRVMAQLDAAPAAVDAKVVDLAVRRAARAPRLAAFWKPAIGFAAAASVGAAAIMLIQPQAEPTAVPASAGLVANGTVAGWSAAAPALRTVSAEDTAHAQMLREYLMDHSSAVADEGVGGTLRYARFAAHTAEYRSDPDAQP